MARYRLTQLTGDGKTLDWEFSAPDDGEATAKAQRAIATNAVEAEVVRIVKHWETRLVPLDPPPDQPDTEPTTTPEGTAP